MQQPFDLINLKREHVKRLANQRVAAGEADVLAANVHYVARPKGAALDILMAALKESGVAIKRSSFDAIALPDDSVVDFTDAAAVKTSLRDMVFVEIKTANQARVRPDFLGFFFALTEGELVAAEVLGDRHRVMPFNKVTGTMLLTRCLKSWPARDRQIGRCRFSCEGRYGSGGTLISAILPIIVGTPPIAAFSPSICASAASSTHGQGFRNSS